ITVDVFPGALVGSELPGIRVLIHVRVSDRKVVLFPVSRVETHCQLLPAAVEVGLLVSQAPLPSAAGAVAKVETDTSRFSLSHSQDEVDQVRIVIRLKTDVDVLQETHTLDLVQ